ncbi:hypothetical protein SELMODRAFT_234501 [Selaginella moellendorffii]|uniref:Peroxidase n=1 Tax=Selaginella moellendorffii TaxID=88036 RepID=D8SLU7_SELML|nr:cationic peroxidase 2 [Selaginella moellendorffii]EFJ14722.1 hypothetical protein SELMODRAFT_234501 [Selaginella moellendorffii]|eukprot:XP_002984212.1 cationic peroxidase 2 [Selaginella moellendorffii]
MELTVLALLIVAAAYNLAEGATRIGFYDGSCPRVEAIVKSTVRSHMSSNPMIGAGVLRLHFHDCFVRGCDGSILIDGPSAEKAALANLGLRGFEVIDDAKRQIEAACPGVVSCADILALAARDAVSESGGQFWPVPLGRRDGRVSSASDASNMPSPLDSVAVLKQKFSAKGLTTLDLATLSGAHTIGQTDCRFFSYRLYNFSSTGKPDPSMSQSTLAMLQQQCPRGDAGLNKVALDTGSQGSFDSSYFKNLRNGGGVLESDQRLMDDTGARITVTAFGVAGVTFRAGFVASMLRMSDIQVLTGSDGEIRRACNAVN